MKHVSLGQLEVSRIGLGAMSMSAYYNIGQGSDAESIRTIHRALELGVTHIDTAEIYGPYLNEELVGRAINGRRDQVVLATKFGLVSHSGDGPGAIDSSPANIRTAIEGSLKRLDVDHVDLYYQHRVDPNIPIEDTIGAVAELVAEGKVATSVYPKLESTRSAAPTLCTRSPHCRPNTPYGPATWKRSCCRCCASSASASFRIHRWVTASSPVKSVPPQIFPTTTGARTTPVSSARTSSATCASSMRLRPSPPRPAPHPPRSRWPGYSAQGDDIAPIPGTKRVARVEENTAADGIALSAEQIERLNNLTPAAGERHDEGNMAAIDR